MKFQDVSEIFLIMCQGLIKLFCFCLIILFFVTCSSKIICYQEETCLKRYNVSLLIERKSQKNISVIIKNRQIIKIGRADSLVLQFYRYNINLRQQHYDSILSNIPNKILVSGLLYEQPIRFYFINHPYNSIIKHDYGYEINVPTDSLMNAINNFGNTDNKIQIKNEFQIFMVCYRNNKIIYQIPSSFFKIN